MIELLQHQFVQNAFLAGTIISIVCAIVGYFVVLRSQAFAGHALSHIGFAGATGAALLGVSALTGTFLFTIIAALGMGTLGKRLQGRDVEIGMVLSFALGLGVLFLKLYTTNANETVGILFGSILSVTSYDLILSVLTGMITLLFVICMFRPLLFSSVDPEVAEARGVPVRFLSNMFMVLLAATVTEAILIVGVLLVFALLVTPAAIAQHISKRPLITILFSILLGLFFTWGGLFLALWLHGPVSFFIAGLASLSYLLIVPLAHIISPHFYSSFSHTDRENKFAIEG
ncbi:MAG TPA: metal ABC transporter permease [Candidatus Sulfotelmatobacter sp.]|jgi:zinc/manganese transport system permease protein|nr:metal ABC transporter permease [Candidatus Sulfotelmatobacter sp.]